MRRLYRECSIPDPKWYGSVEFLAFSKKDTSVIRFENVDIAGELAIPPEGEQLALNEGFVDA